MEEGRCPYCRRAFQPSKFRPGQVVCSDPACQRRRRGDDHRRRLAVDGEYRQGCRDSSRKWRARHHDYWKRRRQDHPEVAEHNRQRQHLRDQRRRLLRLANNTLVLDLKSIPAEVWLVGAGVEDLANNTLVVCDRLGIGVRQMIHSSPVGFRRPARPPIAERRRGVYVCPGVSPSKR